MEKTIQELFDGANADLPTFMAAQTLATSLALALLAKELGVKDGFRERLGRAADTMALSKDPITPEALRPVVVALLKSFQLQL